MPLSPGEYGRAMVCSGASRFAGLRENGKDGNPGFAFPLFLTKQDRKDILKGKVSERIVYLTAEKDRRRGVTCIWQDEKSAGDRRGTCGADSGL